MRTSISCSKRLSWLLPLLFWLLMWQLAAVLVGQELLVPSPARVGAELLRLGGEAKFWQSVLASLLRILAGLAAGVVAGAALAGLGWRVRLIDALFAPLIRVIRATPVASFIILVLLWVRVGAVPAVIAALMVLPIIWESVTAGLKAADGELLELAVAYQMNGWRRWRYIYFPAVRPHFTAGICTAIGLSWKSGVAAEVLCLPKAAIGTELYYAKIYLETPALFAWTITVVLLSLLIERAVRWLLPKYKI